MATNENTTTVRRSIMDHHRFDNGVKVAACCDTAPSFTVRITHTRKEHQNGPRAIR